MMEGLCFYSSKYRVTKGFKFHAQPQTGAYSCYSYAADWEGEISELVVAQVQNSQLVQLTYAGRELVQAVSIKI